MAAGSTRRGAIAVAVLWAIGIVLAACSGTSHGYVPRELRDTLPYEWRGVLFIATAISLESLALYWLLFRLGALRALARTAAALALFGALFALGIVTMVTDMPGWYYVNTFWTMLVLLVLAARLLVQISAAAIARLRARRARA